MTNYYEGKIFRTIDGKFYTNDVDGSGFTEITSQSSSGGTSLTDYTNVVVVDPSGKGDYTTLAAAFAGITDAASNKRYTIHVFGTTVETSNVVAKRYINVVGGEITTSNGSQIQCVGGAVDDQNWYNCRITCVIATSAVSARSTFWNCTITGGFADANGAWQCYLRNCKVSGAWPTTTSASSVFDFSNCEVTFTAGTQGFATVKYRNCNVTYSGTSLTQLSSGKSLWFYGGTFSSASSVNLSHTTSSLNLLGGVTASINAAIQSVGTLNVDHSTLDLGVSGQIDATAGLVVNITGGSTVKGSTAGKLVEIMASSVTIRNSTVINATGPAVLIADDEFAPVLILICNSVLFGGVGQNGLDSNLASSYNIYNNVISPFAAPALVLHASNVTF
jgi:hypothetical protein